MNDYRIKQLQSFDYLIMLPSLNIKVTKSMLFAPALPNSSTNASILGPDNEMFKHNEEIGMILFDEN